MATSAKKTHAQVERELEEDQSEYIRNAKMETFIAGPDPLPPITFRASKPLRERLDQLAAEQHRSRGGLIQHILWTYIHEQSAKEKR